MLLGEAVAVVFEFGGEAGFEDVPEGLGQFVLHEVLFTNNPDQRRRTQTLHRRLIMHTPRHILIAHHTRRHYFL